MPAPPKSIRSPSGVLGEPTPEADGFEIRLPGAQLGDLIQINCMNRIRGAFQLSSGPQRGHLFFDNGRLIHAELGTTTGLDAVVQMLGLRGGSIEPCVRAWPKEITIDMGADALLLRAAQRLDEAPTARESPDHTTTKVVRRAPWPAELAAAATTQRPGDHDAGSGDPVADAPPAGQRLGPLQVVQVSFDGTIQQLKAGASADLADTAFFCQRMASVMGEALGLGECRALAFSSKEEGVVVFKARSIVGTRGANADIDFILQRVGLK
jgi:hypothetical protein